MQDLDQLKQLAEKHTVRYEVRRPELVLVGFDLEFHGTHDHGHTDFSPGCEHCQTTHRDMRILAEHFLPAELRPTGYEISFDQSLHSEARGPNEVVLVVRFDHRHGYFGPVDECEER